MYYQIEPFGPVRNEERFALLSEILVNVVGRAKPRIPAIKFSPSLLKQQRYLENLQVKKEPETLAKQIKTVFETLASKTKKSTQKVIKVKKE